MSSGKEKPPDVGGHTNIREREVLLRIVSNSTADHEIHATHGSPARLVKIDVTENGQVLDMVEAAYESARMVDATTEAVGWSLFDFATCAITGDKKVATGWQLSEPAHLAVAAHADDRDDIHWDSVTHPGGVIWPAVLITARDTAASGDAVAQAAALGHEVMTRLSRALGVGHRPYWHSTTTCGAAAAAAGAASLLSSDKRTIADAIGHATSVAGGSSRALFERSGTRLFHRAHVVDAGIAAAHAAVAGIEATPSVSSMRMAFSPRCAPTATRALLSNGETRPHSSMSRPASSRFQAGHMPPARRPQQLARSRPNR